MSEANKDNTIGTPSGPYSHGAVHEDNETAVESIAERLAEVTSLAEQLDMALRGAQQDCALAAPVSPSIKKIFDGTATSTSNEDWNINTKPPRIEDLKSDEEFLSASEYNAPSRSSSFHTASECRDLSPWWELSSDREDLHKEKMVLAVGLPDLPNPKTVLKPSPEVPPGKIAREVTETTHLKVQHCHTLGVSSYVLTSETVKDSKGAYESTPTRTQVIQKIEHERTTSDGGTKETIIPVVFEDSKDDILLSNMKESGDWIQLKILEVHPELTTLGETLAEAIELQKAHDEVLLQLQSKQSPVEELLRQADQLISTQRPRAEVYAAMADSLGKAWKDVNFHLELRKQILDLNVLYHMRADECKERMKALEMACGEADIPIDIDSVKQFLTNLHDLRRSVLESLMAALQQGNQLLGKLKELAAEGTLDSRPDKIKVSCKQAIAQVERWLEDLHDRRRLLELSWQSRKTQLEQCLALALLASDLRDVEEILSNRREALANSDQLGDSSASAELLSHEHKKLMPEAKELQERAIKITKATEQLVASGCFAGEQAIAKSFAVLESSSDYITDLDNRDSLLDRVIAFFKSAQDALSKLDELEHELTSTDLSPISPELARLHGRIANSLDDITAQPVKDGNSLLDTVGRGGQGAVGVKRKIEELENRKLFLDNLCVAHKEEKRRMLEAFKIFMEKQTEMNLWLGGIAEAFLQGHQDMGSVLPMAKDFLDLHTQLLKDIQTKGTEINALLLTLPEILEHLDESQRREVDSKVEALHDRWVNIKNILEARLDLATQYVKFLTHAEELESEMDTLEDTIKKNPAGLNESSITKLEEKWLALKPLYNKVKSLGEQFITDANKVTDPYLDIPRACLCVQTILERLAGRQINVSESWQIWQTHLTERRDILVQWERNMTESTRIIDCVTKLETQLYPIITSTSDIPAHITSDLEEKLDTLLPNIKKAQNDIEVRIKATDILSVKTQNQDISPQTEAIKNKLSEMNQKLQQIITEYEVMLQMCIDYFKNVDELEKTVENLKTEYSNPNLPHDVADVDHLINKHEASKRSTLEMFKYSQNASDRLITKIRKQEPYEPAEHDVEKILYSLKQTRNNWENAWEERRGYLEQHRELCNFDADLHQINETLGDLSRQLANVRGKYGESLAGAKSTSVAFEYFEKTIELLEERINAFVKSGEEMLAAQHISSPHIENELHKLQARWNDFRQQVRDTRSLIDMSIQYFQIVDEADEWFREGSKLLVTIARKATNVKHIEEANELLTEIEVFLKPGEVSQNERIRRISALAADIFKDESPKQVSKVVDESREMIDSFTSISHELNILKMNLKTAEMERERLKREQEEHEAQLAAAQAEAAIAQAAAAAAEEERRAAEAEREKERLRKEREEHEAKLAAAQAEAAAAKAAAAAAEEARKLAQAEMEKERIKREQEEHEARLAAVQAEAVAAQMAAAAAEEQRRLAEAEKEKERLRIEREEHETKLAIAQAEAAAAKAAAAAAEEARIAAESEITLLKETTVVHKVETVEVVGSIPSTHTIEEKKEVVVEDTPQLEVPTFRIPLVDAVIQEGGRFSFECRVTGFPTPVITWYKDGISIQNNPDYLTTFDQGVCTLTIEETFSEDTGRFSCKAINAAGYDETSANLSVKETEPEEQMIPPSFLKTLEPATAKEGSTFQFECQIQGNPLPTVQWFKNADCIDNSPDYVITYNNGDAKLKFEEVFLEDKAEYTCKASNQLGIIQSSASLSVEPLEPTESPSFVVKLSNVMARAGQKIKLECEVAGIPQPTISWTHNGKPIRETHDVKLHCDDNNRLTLVISEAFPKDAGVYVVTASNLAGEATSACNVSVKGRLPTETSDSEIASDMEPIKPSIQLPLKDLSVFEGKKVRLDCVIVGQPEPEVIWYHDERPVKESPEFQLLFQGDRCSLIIKEAYLEDAGDYKVVAINSAGEASSKCSLSVMPVSETEHVAREPAPKVEIAGTPPTFSKLLSDILVSQGEKVQFECCVTGDPKPEIKWLLNNEEIVNRGNLKFTQSDDGTVILIIDEVSPEDKGVYTVKATNSRGEAKCFAQLIVKTLSISESPLKKTTIVEIPVQIETSTELAPIITFPPDVSHTSSSSYSVQRQVIVQSSHSTSSTISSGTGMPQMEMHSVSSQSQQSYKKVDDKLPEIMQAHKTEEFHQTDKQPAVSHEKSYVSVTKGGHTEIKEEKSSSVEHAIIHKPVRKSVAPRFVSPVIGKIVDQGADVILEGILDGHPIPEVKWTKNGTELLPKEGSVEISWSLNHAKVKLNNVSVKDAGRYTCTAVNEAGSASSTADLVVKKTVFPPVFGRRLQAQVVKKGDRVVMEVEITGTPDPTVTWYKDGCQITSDHKEFQLKTQGNCHSLKIDKASFNHTGKFMVRATNAGGEAQSIADFAVFEPTPDTMVEVVKTLIFEDVEEQERLNSTASQSTKIDTTTTSEKVIPISIEQKVDKPISPVPLSVLVPAQLPPVSVTSSTEVSTTVHSSHKSEKLVTFKMEHTSEPFPDFKPLQITETKPHIIPVHVEKPKTPEPPAEKVVDVQETSTTVETDTIIRDIPIKIESPKFQDDMKITDFEKSSVHISKEIDFKTNTYIHDIPAEVPSEPVIHQVPIKYEDKLIDTVPKEVKEESNIDTSSITKETAYSFFKSKLEEQPPPTKIPAQTFAPVPSEAYTKFQSVDIDMNQVPQEVTEVCVQKIIPKQPGPIYSKMPKPEPFPESKKIENLSSTESYSVSGEFNLVPEPPPEIGFMPKPETPIKTKDVTQKIKHLEETHKDLSPLDVPLGAVKIFPSKPKEEVKEEIIQKQISESVTLVKTLASTGIDEGSPPSSRFKPVKFEPELKEPTPIYHAPLPEPVKPMVSLSEPVYKPVEPVNTFTPITTTIPVFRPQAEIATRPLSPRPSAEALVMEKLWIPHKAPSPEVTGFSSTKQTSESYTLEKQWTQPAPDFKPISHMSTHSTLDKTSLIRPISSLSTTGDKPSAEGLAMDKIWAHKHPGSHLQKSWPPQPSEGEKIAPPWSVQTVVEKKWPHEEITSESSKFESSSKVTKTAFKTESYSSSSKPIAPMQFTQPIQHYISESTVSHFSKMPEQTVTTEKITKHIDVQHSEMHSESVVEEKNLRPSELKKSWPPISEPEQEIRPPPPMKHSFSKVEPILRPISVQDITDEVYLEPGPPPEIGFAEPPKERRQSYVEIIEQDLEKNLEKQPTRVLPGAVRTIPPPPQIPKQEKTIPPPLPPRMEQIQPPPPLPAKPVKIDSKPFEPFPQLEPFPFKAESEKPKSPRPPPPATPSKFVKGEFAESDYESDFDSSLRIKPKWKPYVSDNEEHSTFRRVRPPSAPVMTRCRSTDPEPLPPTKFEKPPQFEGPPRPIIDTEMIKKEIKKDITTTTQKVYKHTKHQMSNQMSKFTDIKKPQPIIAPKQTSPKRASPKRASPPLKPGTPPEYVQAEPPKSKPDSPKMKPKVQQESGYMADTDEPFTLYRKSLKTEEYSKTHKFTHFAEKTSEQKYQQKTVVETSAPKPHFIPKTQQKFEQKSEKKHFTSTSSAVNKELVAPSYIKSVSTTSEKEIRREDRDSSLEPFPFKAEPQRPKRVKCPPPPSPSKFVKGEFKESDIESDYDSRIPPVWRPNEPEIGLSYKPVHPVLTPSGRHSYYSTGTRTPTPPTEFDHPPQIIGPPRPKFEPIEKAKQTVKRDETKTSQTTQIVFKPKPVSAKPVTIDDIIIATPAVKKEVFYIQPGSPPELSYAPPLKQTRYYTSTTGTPYHNATQTETQNVINFNESSENCHRIVNISQTKRIIKFGDQKVKKEEPQLEPFPYKAEPERPRRGSVPAPPQPKKFVPGEFKGSDYESEVESARIKPKWIPGDSDTDEPRYRKVKAPRVARCSSVPVPQQRVMTPMEFDTQPPEMPSKIITQTDGVTKSYKMDVKKKFSETSSQKKIVAHQQQPIVIKTHTDQNNLKPGSPPEYGFVPTKTATKMASKHMNEMTHTFKSKAQQFVNDIMTDVKTSQKPILKPAGPTTTDGSDAQVYREESRVAQHGTKHIDPDTGLIYFKYDFGYEFGIVLPGVGKNGEIPQPKKTLIEPPKRSKDIEFPVLHETTKKATMNGSAGHSKKSTKNAKFEAASESDVSEWEGDPKYRKRNTLPQPSHYSKAPFISIPTTPSPMSLSPSLPSLSPAYNTMHQGIRPSTPSTPSTPGSMVHSHKQQELAQKPPIFITPLRDIAVISGQAARFICIVQSEPAPNILWSKNGRILANSPDYQIQFLNGVCRLTIPRAYPEDAGSYNCTATNSQGTVSTNATLQVPGVPSHMYGTYRDLCIGEIQYIEEDEVLSEEALFISEPLCK